MEELYKKHNYLDKDKKCIINLPIRSYDMSSGGYSILKKNKIFSKKDIKKLDKMDKYTRNVLIGKLVRQHKELTDILMNGFIDARKRFMYYNDLIDDDILSIKKDAIFVINKPCSNLEFDGYKFKVEGNYSSYYYLNDNEFYYSNKNNILDVKGISNECLEKHREFILDDFCNIFKIIEGSDKDYRNKYLQNYRSLYLNRELDIGCYRELNLDSCFTFNTLFANKMKYIIDEFDDIEKIDITYNYVNYLLTIFRMIL